MVCSGYLLFDIECDGFYPNTIFVIVIYDLVHRRRQTYVGLDEVAEAIHRLTEARMVAGHFIRGFDLPVIKRLTGAVVEKDRTVDTVTLSKKLCDLKDHKLATWGEIVGLEKLDSPLFESFTPEMVPYCERDVDVNVLVFDVLLELLIETEQVRDYPILVEYLSALDDHAAEPVADVQRA